MLKHFFPENRLQNGGAHYTRVNTVRVSLTVSVVEFELMCFDISRDVAALLGQQKTAEEAAKRLQLELLSFFFPIFFCNRAVISLASFSSSLES